jgi:hypothetical protein
LSQSHVIQLLGDGYSLVDDNGDLAESGGNEFWNFSYFKDSSYQPSSPLYVVDEQGLKQRKVGINLFIGWNNKSLFFYSISYIQGNNIHFYIVQRDGTSSEDIKNIKIGSQ